MVRGKAKTVAFSQPRFPDFEEDPQPVKTLHRTQREGQLVKPAELIEVRASEPWSLVSRRVYNQLLANAFGPEMADDGKVFRISLAALRGNSTDSRPVYKALSQLRRTEISARLPGGTIFSVQLLGATYIEKDAHGLPMIVRYEIHPELRPILRDSEVFANLDLLVMQEFSSKYALVLYEVLSQRVRMKKKAHEYGIEELRHIFDVPADKLVSFGSFRTKVLEPAQREVSEQNEFFNCQFTVTGKEGRRVTKVTLNWWEKSVAERKAAYARRQEREARAEQDPTLDRLAALIDEKPKWADVLASAEE